MIRRELLLVLGVLLFAGCSCSCTNEGFPENEGFPKKTGHAIGETVTDFATGIGSGVDKGMEVSVELTEKTSGLGISKTVSKQLAIDKKGITVYLITEKPVKTQLVAKALNAEGQEVGRSAVDVEMAADDAKYVEFIFGPQLDMQRVDKFIVDAREQKPKSEPKADVSDAQSGA